MFGKVTLAALGLLTAIAPMASGQSVPSCTGFSPTSGGVGTQVTLTGTFQGGVNTPYLVRFGFSTAVQASKSGNNLTATTPSNLATGLQDVFVLYQDENTSGSGLGEIKCGGGQFQGLPAAPTITGITPTSGPEVGGTQVTITGTGFVSPLSVTFGGVAGTILSSSLTSITVSTPSGTGTVSVAVTALGGTATQNGAFTYIPSPSISGISPNSGPVAGGTSVTITGANFTCVSSVTFGGVNATSYQVNSATQITAIAPPGQVGYASVIITNCNGSNAANQLYQYTQTAPTLSGINPSSGPIAGNNTVTITGTNFTCVSGVSFGNVPAVTYTVVSSTQITATVPPGTAAGVVSVTVTNCGGTSNGLSYTYSVRPGGPFQCTTQAGSPPLVRSEGLAELVGDIVLSCTGGTPTAIGQPVPLVNFTVYLNTNITSRLYSNNLSEALLMIDEPAPAQQRFCVAGNCGTLNGTGAMMNYATNTDAKNIYQGKKFIGAGANENSVTWDGIPIDPPGADGTRVIRITNIRANANMMGGSGTFIPTQIVAYIAISPPTGLPINNPQQTVAFVSQGKQFSVRDTLNPFLQCTSVQSGLLGTNPSSATRHRTLRFREGFASSFKRRISNQSVDTVDAPGAADAQNLPGNQYQTESGFTGGAVGAIGEATQGTRLHARFTNVPAGASLFVTALNDGAAPGGTHARLTNTDGLGGGAYSAAGSSAWVPVNLVNGAGSVVWEVINANPNVVEDFDFGVSVAYAANTSNNLPGLGSASVAGTFAPLSNVGVQSATAPLPRFVDDGVGAGLFTINACTTNLLFPFLTNQAGFDSGIAISNTSVDPFGTPAQAGACKLNYYGETMGGGAAPAMQTSEVIPSGRTLAVVLSSGGNYGVKATPGFQGYMIAQCAFQYAHGFAFISDVGANRVSEAYLALIMDASKDNLSSGLTRTGYRSETLSH